MTICTSCEHCSPVDPSDLIEGWLGHCQLGYQITWGYYQAEPERHLMRALEGRPFPCECSFFKRCMDPPLQLEVVIRIRPEDEYPIIERIVSAGEVHNLTWNDVVHALRDGPSGIAPKQWILRVVGCINRFEPEVSWSATFLRGNDAWTMNYIQPSLVEKPVVLGVERLSRFERILQDD